MFSHGIVPHGILLGIILVVDLPVSVVALARPLAAPHVSIVTWNILAPQYAIPSKYPWSSKQNLDWKVRQSKIVKQLLAIDADIICLQEVQVDSWQGLLIKLVGYHGVLQQMSRNHPVANAILVREGLTIVKTESRSRALIAVIVDETSTSPLYLANVHLDATPESDVTRLNQIKSLLKRLENQIYKDNKSLDAAIVIAGDCNMVDESPLYKLLSTGSIGDDTDSRMTKSNVSSLLPLKDVYSSFQAHEHSMTYRSGHVLDYIWISNAVECHATLPLQKEEASPQAWPDDIHPSDHVPIGAVLSWSGAPFLKYKNNCDLPTWQQGGSDLEDVLDPWTIRITSNNNKKDKA